MMEASVTLGLVLLLCIVAAVTGRPNGGPRSAEEEPNFDTMVRFLVKKLSTNEHQLQMMGRRFDKMTGSIKLHSLLLQRLKNELRSYRGKKQKTPGNLTREVPYYSDSMGKRKFLHRVRRQAYSFLSPEMLETLTHQEVPSKNDTPMAYPSEPPPLPQEEPIFENIPDMQSTPGETIQETTQTVVFSTASPLMSSTLAELKPEKHHVGEIDPTGGRVQQPEDYFIPDYFDLPQAKSTPPPSGVAPYDLDEEYEAGDSGSRSPSGHQWGRDGSRHDAGPSGHQIEPDEMEYRGRGTFSRDPEADEHHRTMFDHHPGLFGDQHGNRRSFKDPLLSRESDYEVPDKEKTGVAQSGENENPDASGLSRKRRFQPMAIRAHDPRVEFTPEIKYPLEPEKPVDTEEPQPSESGKPSNAGIVWISNDSEKDPGTTQPDSKAESPDNPTLQQDVDGKPHDYQGDKEADQAQSYQAIDEQGADPQGKDEQGTPQQGGDEQGTPQAKQDTNEQGEPRGHQGPEDHGGPHFYPGINDHGVPHLYPSIDEHGIPHYYPGIDEHGVPHLYPGIDEHGIPHIYSGIDGHGIPYGSQIGDEYGTHLLPIEDANNHRHSGQPGDQEGTVDKNRFEGIYAGQGFIDNPYGIDGYHDYPIDGDPTLMGEEKQDGSDESSDEDAHMVTSAEVNKMSGLSYMERSRTGDIRASAERPAFNMDLYPAESNTIADTSAQVEKDSDESSEVQTNTIGSLHRDYRDPIDNQLLMFNKEYPDGTTLLEKIQAAANQRHSIHQRPNYEITQNQDRQNQHYGRTSYSPSPRRESNTNRFRYNPNRRGFHTDFRRGAYDMNMGRLLYGTTPSRQGYGTTTGHSAFDKGFDRLNYDNNFGRSVYDTGRNPYNNMNQNRGYSGNVFRNEYNGRGGGGYNPNPGRGGYMGQPNRHNIHLMRSGHNMLYNRYDTRSGFNLNRGYNNQFQSNRPDNSYKLHKKSSDEVDAYGTEGYYNYDSGENKDERKNNTHQDSAEKKSNNYFMY